jgi:hypothetical protein
MTSMTPRERLETMYQMRPADRLAPFMLTYGQDYAIGPDTFTGPRGTPKLCFMNAGRLAIDNPALTYVEGQITCCRVPIDHAWCVDASGTVVEPTLRPSIEHNTYDHIGNYFGVPFRTDYLRKAIIRNQYWGLLGYEARKTLPSLIELGLEAGQQQLITGRKRKSR